MPLRVSERPLDAVQRLALHAPPIHLDRAQAGRAWLGMPVPRGMAARTPGEGAAAASKLGAVAVKAQVPVGGRGKAGGIKLARTAGEARAAAQQIIGMDIKGFKVPLVYCEEALEIGGDVERGFK